MNNMYFDYIGKKYYIDMDSICDYINFASKNDIKEREITDTYDTDTDDGAIKLQTKFVREVTHGSAEEVDTLRYDLVKLFLEHLLKYGESSEEIKNNQSFNLVFNTLLNKGFIKVIENG